MTRRRTALAFLLSLACGGCFGPREQGSPAGETAEPLRITCTTGMVGYNVERIGAAHVRVTSLMGPGVDPHLFKASQRDVHHLTEAEAIFYNGLNLEGKMGDLFEKMRASGKATVPIAEEGVDRSLLRSPAAFQGHPDPHIWFDVSMWSQTLKPIVSALSALRPEGRVEFEENAEHYRKELEHLHEECRTRLAEIPRERRVLITAHDAFGYFGRAYDVEVIGLQGISTSSEYGLADIRRIVDLIAARKIKAVFVESSVPRRSIEAVVEGCKARGHAVTIGGTLYSDAMGDAGTPAGTYPGMVRANLDTIVGALK